MDYNVTSVNATAAQAIPIWIIIFDNVQLATAIIGVIANLMTLITLVKNGDDFSDIIRMLFKYQSALDCGCSLQACLLFTLPPWYSGNYYIDAIVCQAWYSQFLYWFNVLMSIWNLMTLACERYICVCHPLKYNILTTKHFYKVIFLQYIVGLIYLAPGLFQTRLREGLCRSEIYWDGAAMARFFYAYSIIAFFCSYVLPTTFFFVMYGLVVLSFKKRAKSNLGASGSAAVVEKASNELTKTAIVVTGIFIIALGVDLWYYTLANVGVVPYVFNSPIQKICVLFAVINSVANPFVYASFMPSYRKSVKKTFFKACCKE